MIDSKQAISVLVSAKKGGMRPSYLYVLFTFDGLSKGKPHTIDEVADVLDEGDTSIRTTVSRLCSMGYLQRESKGKFTTTDKWNDMRADICKRNRRVANKLTK